MKFPQWLRRAAALAVAAAALTATPITDAQSVLSEPDFTAMFAPDVRANILARDGQRGWNYVVVGDGAFVNGVQMGPLVRVNDSGQVDLSWIVASDVRPGNAFVLSNGELLFSPDGNPFFLQTLQRGTDGVYRSQQYQWTRDSVYQSAIRWPIARDAQGNRYAVFFTVAADATRIYTLRRITSAGVPDANWRLDIGDPGNITHLAVGADGSVFYAAQRTNVDGFGTPATSTIYRTSASDSLRWSQPFSGDLSALTADAVGRPYLSGRNLASPGKPQIGNLLRFDATGAVDARWSPQLNVANSSGFTALPIVDDRIVVVSGDSALVATQVSLLDGSVLATQSVVGPTAVAIDDSDSTIAVTTATGIVLLTSNPAGFSERRIALSAGSGPVIASIKRWGNSYVMAGRFEYWYGGVRYAKIARLGADLKPDPTWQPGITGIVNAIEIDRDGGLLVGGENLLGAQSNLIRFTPQGQLDPRWRKSFDSAVNTVTAAADGDVFAGGRFGTVDGVNRASIVRFQIDGSMQPGWAPSPPWQLSSDTQRWQFSGEGVQKIIDAGDGGILVYWRRFGLDLDDTLYWTRLSRDASGAAVTSASALDRINPNSVVQDPVSGRLFATKFIADPVTRLYRQSIIRLLPITLEIDPFWSPPTADADVAAITETHFYLTNNRRTLRSANSATNDLVWTIADRNRPALAGWIDTTKAGDALMWAARGAPQAIRSPTQAVGQRTAIEYFAKSIQRFFITTRAAEQQQLDALPTQFARTGMQFGTFDGEVTPPTASVVEAALPPPPFSAAGALPICRFYSPPERGGSNTHFYGDGTDCQVLNTVSGVVNEGYDFAAPVPAALTGLCPVNASAPVYRMFNNQSASNNSNHRYVVSLARIDEMKARGWVNEGVAFCATSVTDSKGFGQWLVGQIWREFHAHREYSLLSKRRFHLG